MDIDNKLCNRKVFGNNLIAFHQIKTILILNKPTNVRMCIRDLIESTNVLFPL